MEIEPIVKFAEDVVFPVGVVGMSMAVGYALDQLLEYYAYWKKFGSIEHKDSEYRDGSQIRKFVLISLFGILGATISTILFQVSIQLR